MSAKIMIPDHIIGGRRPAAPARNDVQLAGGDAQRLGGTPIDHAALIAHDEPRPTGERGLDAAE